MIGGVAPPVEITGDHICYHRLAMEAPIADVIDARHVDNGGTGAPCFAIDELGSSITVDRDQPPLNHQHARVSVLPESGVPADDIASRTGTASIIGHVRPFMRYSPAVGIRVAEPVPGLPSPLYHQV